MTVFFVCERAMSELSIIGLGWLGEPLAHALLARGMTITGSVTSEAKACRLRAEGVHALCWQATQGMPLPAELVAPVMIVMLPPGRCHDYLDALSSIVTAMRLHGGKQLLFISSTSVYGLTDTGCEVWQSHPDEERGQLLLAAERLLIQSGFLVTIVRAAGLFGPGRYPGRFLAGRKTSRAGAPVNLVHQADMIGITSNILTQGAWGQLFNACAPSHPTRRAFYERACTLAGLPLPEFSDESMAGKQIDGSLVERVLGYRYTYPDPSAALMSLLA